MVERIIHKIIDENIDIDRLLVVTFTNAAASEMRERVLDAIYKKLEENPDNQNLQRQITLLNKSNICTIDSFCLEVVKNNFYELNNVSPSFRIADSTEIDLLKQEVIEDIFEKKYEEQNEDFIKLINTYTTYKDDEPLKELVLKIYSYIQSCPFPEKWLHDKIEMYNIKDNLDQDFGETVWGQVILEDVSEELIDAISTLQRIEKDLSYNPELDIFQKTVRNDIELLDNLKNHLNSWEESYTIWSNLEFTDWPRKKVESEQKEVSKKARTTIKDKIKKKLNAIFISSSKEINCDIYDMYEILLKLETLILEFSNEFAKRKREKNIVDFNDIEHFALEIFLKQNEDGSVSKTEVAKRYQEKFQEIAIDEYQDSNMVQEYILTSISNGKNVFMVGDGKQSIYKFRQAMPEQLFIKKYDTYKNKQDRNDKDGLKIQLFMNFRSRDNVLQFTNLIFENIMSNVLGNIEYNEDEYLNFGAKDYEKIEQDLSTEIDIINLKEEEPVNQNESSNDTDNQEINIQQGEDDEEERIENIELEAKFVAKKIKNMIENKYQIYDRKQKSFRDICPKDIVILLRTTKRSSICI